MVWVKRFLLLCGLNVLCYVVGLMFCVVMWVKRFLSFGLKFFCCKINYFCYGVG